jgi:signal transduction histidine kinase/ActR/RegA family two-component response regulator
LSGAADDRDARVEELKGQLKGLRSRLEKLGGEVVRADYKVLHLTQEVRRARQAFDFLTGFQNNISRARSIDVLYRIALKSIISELWMKRAVLLERNPGGDVLRPVEWLGYGSESRVGELGLPTDSRPQWSKPQVVNSETAPADWIDSVGSKLNIPYFVWIPAVSNGRVEAALVAGTLEEDAAQEPKLTEHDLDLFVSIGAILWVGRMNLLARGRLKRQVVYQSLLHRVSSMLLQDYDSPSTHFDDVISRVGATWALDRIRLLTRRTDKRLADTSHEWTAKNVAPTIGEECYPLERVRRWREAMANGDTIRIDGVDSLPQAEAEVLREAGIGSLLVVPINVKRSVIGWASFELCDDARVWTPEDVQLLEVTAGLISRAVAREREIEDRSQLESEYHHSKKMEAIGQLAGGVAHDFNNLLTTIQGYAQLLTSKLPEEYREMPGLKEIVMASERAAVLTRQLLSFSRRDTATSGPVEVNKVISETMKLVSRMMGDRTTVQLDLAPDLETIVGDSQQISQVIMNLAVNARDAMPDGGTFKISTRQYTAGGALAQRFSIPGIEKVQVIEVSDTGHGMSEETKERIFEPFFTTKDAGQGTGLGLSIVFSAVRRHAGFVDVASKIGKGTTFTIFLPAKRPEDEEEKPEYFAAGTHVGHETILLVEDDTSVRSMIAEALESQGYDILAVSNGREALSELEDSKDTVSLIVTDIVMPEMGGVEMFHELGGENSDIPVIAMSGFPESKESARLLSGAVACLRKPFGPDEICAAVRRALDGAQATHRIGRGVSSDAPVRALGAVPDSEPGAATAGGAPPPAAEPETHRGPATEPAEGTT